jgi:glycosyltransferase involved in cell wall biosynthesis
MLKQLSSLQLEWELIVVNDGSTDESATIVHQIAKEHPNLRLESYPTNRGRGCALRKGIASARGEIIVTTEIDLSWGENIVHELVSAMNKWPDADIVVASPHLPGGGYRNVPAKRVWLSRIGNHVIRTCMTDAVTMNTGMTRAYRRSIIQSLPLTEDGKEFHLEVILKATAFGFRIYEIPAVLEWKEYKRHGKQVSRKSASRVNRLVISHSLFSVFANPVRYVWLMSLGSLFLSIVFFGFAVVFTFLEMVAAYSALMSIALLIVSIVLFVLGVVVKQGNMIQRELWVLQRSHLLLHRNQEMSLRKSKEEITYKT